jgi:protocatechuate 3,4-dioxygenase alpha subunit
MTDPLAADGGGGLIPTPSQTVGPFFGYALPYVDGPRIRGPWQPDAIRIHGFVTDGAGAAVPDAIIELWGADSDGRPSTERGSLARDGHGFTGFGRAAADRAGHYSFDTVKPGAGARCAPYLVLAIYARGLLHHLYTRAYFDDETVANENDPVLRRIDASRRTTVLAGRDAERSYRFDIRLQGEGETVFLDFGTEL